ncbi:MAG: acyl-CoA dehydrogenase family protein, partial [Parvibaculum sp.]
MAIDFSFSDEVEVIRTSVRTFIDEVVKPLEQTINEDDRKSVRDAVIKMRTQAYERGLWLPHMPEEWGGMGLGHVELAMVSAEAARARFGPFAINCQAPDEGNMHTLMKWGTAEQKDTYLRPMCEGR